MTQAERVLRKRFRSVYQPLVDRFFSELEHLGCSEEELHAIPSLFLPSCGVNYAQSLIKVAVIGEATLGWGDGLNADLEAFKGGTFDVESGFPDFQNDGPVCWRNKFWQYHAGVMNAIYSRRDALNEENPVFSSVAWGNSYAIEPYRTSGSSVDMNAISWEKYHTIAVLADECGLSSFDNFIRAFEPNVIIYTCRNNYGSDRVLPKLNHPWQRANPSGSWVINCGRAGSTWIVQTQHPSWIGRQGVNEATFGAEMAKVMLAHGCFAPLGRKKFFWSKDDKAFSVFASMLNGETKKILAQDPDIGDFELSHRLILSLGWELNRQQATMTAALMVRLLNQIEKFRTDNWLYSPERRGPCRVARGAWSAYYNAGEKQNAAVIAEAFTRLDGNYAWA